MFYLNSKSVLGAVMLSAGMLGVNNSFSQADNLFISEYVEGSGYNKYVEIYNGTGFSIDLSEYAVKLYSNGSATPTVVDTLSGTIANNSTIVLRHPSATAYLGASVESPAVNFNGDDAFVLEWLDEGEVDIFGVRGCDPGSKWTSASNRTSDRTLRRNSDVTGGIVVNPTCNSLPTDFTTLESEWQTYAQDNVAGLGQFPNATSPINGCATDLFFSEYLEGTGNNKCLEIANYTGAAINLAEVGYQIKIYFNGSVTEGTFFGLSGTLADGDVYVVCDDNAAAEFLAAADLTPTNNFFNGDDAVVLMKGNVVVDIIGRIGEDPGSAWTSGALTTKDSTLVRNSNVTGGVTTNPVSGFPTLSTEWTAAEIDNETGLGSHTSDCDPQSSRPATATIGEEVLSSNALKAAVYPNPTSSITTVEFSTTTSSLTTVKIYDTQGRVVAEVFNGFVEAGNTYRASFDANELPAGVYVFSIGTESETQTGRLVVR